MNKISFFAALALASLSLAACSSIRVVQKTPQGGVVALQGDREEAMQKAVTYMQSQCPTGYQIVEEGEAVIGQDIQTETTQNRSRWGNSQSTRGSTTDKREWRVTYACKDASGKQGALRSYSVAF
jgi:hypothetical protein